MRAPPVYARRDPFPHVIFWPTVALLIAFAVSCTTVKRVAVSGGPPAIAAGVGALAGPAVAALAAGVTAVVVVALADNADLRSGETMSEEQIDKELARWRGRAYEAEAKARDLDANVGYLHERVANEKEWWKTWALRVFWLGLALFAWRNREHIFKLGPGYLARFAHSFFGPAPKLRRKLA